jgi:hypothetical protein
MDWREFFETMSVVERKLREDPGGLYGRMDFTTRDHYRHAVERIAKSSALTEVEVARKAIQLAHEGASAAGLANGDEDRSAHVGFYLVDKGQPRLERAAAMRRSSVDTLCRLAGGIPLALYLGTILAITASATAALALRAHAASISDELLATLVILLAIGTSQLAVGWVNWFAALLVTPRPLPRMDYSEGNSAAVAHPGRGPDAAPARRGHREPRRGPRGAVPRQSRRAPALRLAHRFRRCGRGKRCPGDAALLELARAAIEGLNEKYGRADAFFLFHRPRRWNPRERAWMGHERKRGKLSDVNALLRGRAEDRFSLVVGDTGRLARVKYVITLDTDTQLPRDCARQFVGVMAHPLNRARFSTDGPLVTEGYGILQPRVSVSLPGANRSWYARLHAGEPGRRSLYAGRLRRLPGCARRGFVHRQGDLRRRRVRALAGRAVPRQPHPQPRSPRGLLRALRVVERRAALRGVSLEPTART